MPEELRAQHFGTLLSSSSSAASYTGDGGSIAATTMQPADDEIQYAPRSRPVSFYDNFKDVSSISPCVTSAMSVGNLSQVRDGDASSTMSQGNHHHHYYAHHHHHLNGNNNNNNNNNNNKNNNSRVISAMSAGNVSKIQSVKVTGAVSTGNIGRTCRAEKDAEGLDRAPSMANCLSTTVPVNLAASQIAGRHTPTRNSLRHSRMIVLHRTGHQQQKFLPPLVYHCRLARCLAALQTILGVAVTSLSLWLLLWAPNLPITDNPYWSGMPLLLSGSFGVCLLCCFKKEYPDMSPGVCLSITKAVSAVLAILATLACVLACAFAAMHLTRLMGLECTPARVLNATCVCKPRDLSILGQVTSFKYMDLNCPEVESILTILLIFSSACNAFGAITSGWYSYLHWSTRRKRPKYVQVRTSTNTGNTQLNSRPIYGDPNMSER